MKREKIIENLVSQFAESVRHLSDKELEQVESGKLVISLTTAIGDEAGGASKVTQSNPKVPQAARQQRQKTL